MFNLHQLHTATGIIIVLAFCVKVCIHVYLDQAMGKTKTWQSILFFPLPFMTPYRQKVGAENQGMKNLCNLMFYTYVIALSVNLVVGILEYQTK